MSTHNIGIDWPYLILGILKLWFVKLFTKKLQNFRPEQIKSKCSSQNICCLIDVIVLWKTLWLPAFSPFSYNCFHTPSSGSLKMFVYKLFIKGMTPGSVHTEKIILGYQSMGTPEVTSMNGYFVVNVMKVLTNMHLYVWWYICYVL